MTPFWTIFVAAGAPVLLTLLISRLVERKPNVCYVRGTKHEWSHKMEKESVGQRYVTTTLIIANRGSKPATDIGVNLPEAVSMGDRGSPCRIG